MTLPVIGLRIRAINAPGVVQAVVAAAPEQHRVGQGAGDGPGLIEAVLEADRLGLQVAWLSVGGVAPDPFVVFGVAAARGAEQIEFGTGIIPTYPRHPLATAQGAMTVDQIAPGRLRLGVGPSMKPIMEGMWGLPFRKPLTHLREYVTILNDVLSAGAVSFHGELLHAEAANLPPTGVRVMISALRPKSYRLCGEIADGAISSMTPSTFIRDVAAPALEEGARSAQRARPKVIMHVPIALTTDRDAVRHAMRRQQGFYLRLPHHSKMLEMAGFPDAGTGTVLTDAMADAIAVWGTENEITDRIGALPSDGVDEIAADPLLVGDDPQPVVDRTMALLSELAKAARKQGA